MPIVDALCVCASSPPSPPASRKSQRVAAFVPFVSPSHPSTWYVPCTCVCACAGKLLYFLLTSTMTSRSMCFVLLLLLLPLQICLCYQAGSRESFAFMQSLMDVVPTNVPVAVVETQSELRSAKESSLLRDAAAYCDSIEISAPYRTNATQSAAECYKLSQLLKQLTESPFVLRSRRHDLVCCVLVALTFTYVCVRACLVATVAVTQ